MDPRTELMKDDRPIQAIYWPQEDNPGWRVGESGVTAIVPYEEYGENCMLAWIAVFRGDEIIVRVPAQQVSVHYV